MSENHPFMRLEVSCDNAVPWVIQQMSAAGWSVLPTFNLKVGRLAKIDYPCPHHGTDNCDCQLVVLLVYAGHPEPLSLVAFGREAITWISLVDNPHHPAGSYLSKAIHHILTCAPLPGCNPSPVSQAA